MALRWCRANMGTNRRRRWRPSWHIVMDKYDSGDYGEYDADDNEIYIYWNNIPTVEDLIRTAIHEWQHQLQPLLANYHKHECYKSNPYEIEAREAEDRLFRPCWDAVRTKLNKNFLTRDHSNRKIKRSRSSTDE